MKCIEEFEKIDGVSRFYIHKIFGKNKKQYFDDKLQGPKKLNGNRIPLYEIQSIIDHCFLKYSKEEFLNQLQPFKDLFYTQDVWDLIKEIEKKFKSISWFKKYKISCKMGVLLHGKPGSGKSSFARNIAIKLNVPLYFYDLSSLSNDELVDNWQQMEKPCVVLFEDIDNVFNGRTNISGGDLTFDCLLNCISGVSDHTGILLIITTNDISKIDPALGNVDKNNLCSRPGRIDRILEFKATTEETRLQMANYFLSKYLKIEDIEKLVKSSEGDMPAQFQDKCIKIIMEKI